MKQYDTNLGNEDGEEIHFYIKCLPMEEKKGNKKEKGALGL